MPITISPSLIRGGHDPNRIVSFHDTGDASRFYQETATPFMLLIMSVRKDSPDTNAFSLFTPETQFNAPLRAVKGRRSDSMHQHNHFEFTYILRGNMYQIVEGKRYLYPPGSCCLMNRNTLHTEEISTDYTCIFFSVSSEFIEMLMNYGNSMLFPQEQNGFRNLIFEFMTQNMEDEHKNTKDFLDFVPRINETEQKVIVHGIFEQMITTLISPYYGATYRIKDLFFQLIDILCDSRYYNVVHVTAGSSMDSLLFARIDQLLETHRGRITNHDLSLLLNYDGSYLGRIVKKHTGMSLFDYSMTFTMKAAADLLCNTQKSVSEIAAELQFGNRTHFYKIFEAYYHMTPKEYREQKKKQKPE